MAARAEVREFINRLGPLLERAQAEGVLARMKLDVRDQFEATVSGEGEAERSKSLALFAEELDAFCADMRLAALTVQNQVERHKRRWLRGIMFGIGGAFGCLVLSMILASAAHSDLQYQASAFLLFICGPIVFFYLLVVGSRPVDLTVIQPRSGTTT